MVDSDQYLREQVTPSEILTDKTVTEFEWRGETTGSANCGFNAVSMHNVQNSKRNKAAFPQGKAAGFMLCSTVL
jgi:hypothetical protein